MIYYILGSAIIGGLLNRLRGGWAVDSGISVTHGTLRIIVALFATSCLYFPYWQQQAFNSTDWMWFTGVAISIFFFGLVQGWGSWFTIGRDPSSYQHNSDWIVSELLAKWVYGRKDSVLKLSPTWRRNRELFAMNVRGLNITLPTAIIFYFHIETANPYVLALLAISGYSLGHLYELGWKVNLQKMPKFMRWQTAFGEVVTGATLLSSVLMIGSWLSIKLI